MSAARKTAAANAAASASSAPKKAETIKGKELESEEVKRKMEAEIALAVQKAQQEATAQKIKDDETAAAKLQAIAMEKKMLEDANEKAKAETKKLTDELEAILKHGAELEKTKRNVPWNPTSGDSILPNGSVVMGGLPTDSSLEGIVKHILSGLMTRHERKPSAEGPFSSFDRILKSLVDDRDTLTFSNIDLSLEDLLIDISPAQAEILGRHVGISAQGRVPRKAFLKYLKEEAYNFGFLTKPPVEHEKLPTKRLAVQSTSLVIPVPTAVTEAPGSVESLRKELNVTSVPLTAPSPPPAKSKDTSVDMEGSQKKRRSRPKSAMVAPTSSTQEQDDIPISPSKSSVWDRVALPPNWERRLDQKNGKSYYVNHVERSTQWHHPLDPDGVGKKKKTKKAAEDNYSSTDRLKGSTLPGVAGKGSNSDFLKDERKKAWGDTT